LSNSIVNKKKASLIHLFACIAGYTCYFLLNLLFLCIFPFILVILLLIPGIRQSLFEKLYLFSLSFLTRFWLPFIGIYKIVENLEHIPDAGNAAIIISNHRSRIEGPLLMSRLKRVGVVMKSAYARLPVYSSLVKHYNFISVDPSSLDSLSLALGRCKELLASEHKLLIFPEGARARSRRMLPFKDMAFRLSIETGIPVIPVVVHTNYPFMAKIKGSIFPPETMTLSVRSLPPATAAENERASEFCERVRQAMATELKRLDSGTVWEHL
jgi:1-acyl-sn-glycerol-3-phosphate acyltransferase